MEKLRPGLRWLAAAAVVMMLSLLGWQCIDIQMAANTSSDLAGSAGVLTPVYTLENVQERLIALRVPFFLCAAVIVLALAARAGGEKSDERHSLSPSNLLRLWKKRIAHLPEAAVREEKFRRNVYLAAGMVVLICAAFCLMYLLDGSHFVSWELEAVMGEMMLHITPWTILALTAIYVAGVLRDRSMQRECGAFKGMAGAVKQEGSVKTTPVNAVRVILAVAAVVFIVLGVMNGGLYDVLVKAINICTECIGLG